MNPDKTNHSFLESHISTPGRGFYFLKSKPKQGHQARAIVLVKYPLLLLLLLGLYGCPCESSLIDNGPIPENYLALIPYQDSAKYTLEHSEGQQIIFSTTRNSEEMFDFFRGSCNDVMYELNTTLLVPDYPLFNIKIELYNVNPEFIDGNILLGNEYFLFPSPDFPDEIFQIVDSLMIDSTSYKDVFKLASSNNHTDVGEIFIDSLYYNYSFGILKIIMSNGEYYKIIP